MESAQGHHGVSKTGCDKIIIPAQEDVVYFPPARAKVEQEAKVCPSCGRLIHFTGFNKDLGKYDGLKATCRECSNARERERYRVIFERNKKCRPEARPVT